MTNSTNIFHQFFGEAAKNMGIDNTEYRCVKCSYPLAKMVLEEPLTKKIRKLFYCKEKKCSRFGFVTVVAKK